MFNHFIFDKLDGFFRNITPIVVEAGIISEEWEECVPDTTAQLDEVADFLLFEMQMFEEGDGGDFPLEVSSILEEVAFVIEVEFIPDNLGVMLGLLIFFL